MVVRNLSIFKFKLTSLQCYQKMSVKEIFITVFLWMYMKIILNIIFIPMFIKRPFKKGKKCPPIQDSILLMSASNLAEQIRQHIISSETVVKTYIGRVREVNPIINAVIEDRFEEALEDARRADKLVSSGELTVEELKQKYPLLGVPITIKGSISVAGLKNTSGLVDRNGVMTEDAVCVRRVKEAGAIPLLTSNVPELCLNWETTNKLVGTTKNPYNTTRTVGGSSGGEACLLASGASVLGLGSDIAGSLRLPAHFCGVWGHKPTPGIVSFVGHYPDCKNVDDWKSVFTLGPMARYGSELRPLLEIISEPEYKEQLMLHQQVDVRNIRIYYIYDFKSPIATKVNKNVIAAINAVVAHFNTISTINCEEVNIPLMKQASNISNMMLLCIDEIDNLFTNNGEGSIGELFRYITCRSKRKFTSIVYGVLRNLYSKFPNDSFPEVKKSVAQLRNDVLNILGDNGILITPIYPAEAHHHGDVYRKLFDAGYMSIFNSLGFPATSCPVLQTKNGLPVGVQVVAAPFCDRLTLTVAEEIERVFGGWKPPSFDDSQR